LSNFSIAIDGDYATARTHVDAIVMGPKGFGVVETFGWYDDELILTTDGWRIRFRRTTVHGARLPGPLRLIPPAIAGRIAAYMGGLAGRRQPREGSFHTGSDGDQRRNTALGEHRGSHSLHIGGMKFKVDEYKKWVASGDFMSTPGMRTVWHRFLGSAFLLKLLSAYGCR